MDLLMESTRTESCSNEAQICDNKLFAPTDWLSEITLRYFPLSLH